MPQNLNHRASAAQSRGATTALAVYWLFPYSHEENPILVQALQTLEDQTKSAFVLDRTSRRNARRSPESYRHLALGRHPFRLLYPLFLLEMLLRTIYGRPALVLASTPDTGVVALAAAWWLSIPLVYYPFELFGEEMTPATRRRERAWLKVEKWLLSHHRTSVVITQNTERGRVYESERGASGKVVLIHNYKRWSPVPRKGTLRKALDIPPSVRIVLYEGALMEGRCLVELVTAAQFFPPHCLLVLLGKESAYARSHLLPLIQSLGLEHRVKVFGRVPHEWVRDYVVDADVGVITYANTCRNNHYCEPGKLSDYVLSGVPIIAPPFPTMVSRVEAAGVGKCLAFDCAESIANGVSYVLSRPRAYWSAALEAAASRFVWETQAPVLLTTIDALLQNDSSRPPSSCVRELTRSGPGIE